MKILLLLAFLASNAKALNTSPNINAKANVGANSDITSLTAVTSITGVTNISATTVTVTSGLIGPVAGTLTNDAAAPGYVGEILTGNAAGSTVPGSDVFVAVATVTLSAGDWDLTGMLLVDSGATTAMTNIRGGVSTSVTSQDSFASGGALSMSNTYPVSGSFYFPVGTRRVSVASSTPYYLVVRVTYTVVGGLTVCSTNCFIRARRVR